MLDSLHEKDHAGIVIFENGATTAAYLSPFKERVRARLLNWTYQFQTRKKLSSAYAGLPNASRPIKLESQSPIL